MELKDRIAAVRKTAGLTQEQLGELVGVSRQAVSKWEAGQTIPDAVTIARLCEALHVSADYVLLGREPEEDAAASPAYILPDTCPCCGRPVSGTVCPICGYDLPTAPPRGPRYALISLSCGFTNKERYAAELAKYCGFSTEKAQAVIAQGQEYSTRSLLRRDMTDGAALYIASHLDHDYFTLRLVEDCGESEDALLIKPQAMELPPQPKRSSGIGFWGVVGAVIVALLILSFL